ncbi:uncharacterized protein LOC131670429 [Phymastichus coffea]|uniref:uncharacterized protein LOC131670429 n=1 Tax=Phymastichus coffea TaxID=108790 RepID=UPI00273BD6B0|nr:uncharacterized protein LOC131670429 [Phymastichus coffea]
MKHCVCLLLLAALAFQLSAAHSPNSQVSNHENHNFEWLQGHPEKDEIIKNYKAWMSCKNSQRPQSECDALYDILVAPAPIIIQKLHHYKNLVNTVALKDDRKIHEMKIQLYPWTDIYDLCNGSFPQSYCDVYIKYLHLPENRMRHPETLKQMMWQQICVASGKSAEECANEAAAAAAAYAAKMGTEAKSAGNGGCYSKTGKNHFPSVLANKFWIN